jgi:hypothetical protein
MSTVKTGTKMEKSEIPEKPKQTRKIIRKSTKDTAAAAAAAPTTAAVTMTAVAPSAVAPTAVEGTLAITPPSPVVVVNEEMPDVVKKVVVVEPATTRRREDEPRGKTKAPYVKTPYVKQQQQQDGRDLDEMLKEYIENVTKDGDKQSLELEVKFGTRGIVPITRINYDNIIKKLLSVGFVIDSNEYMLRITNEYSEPHTGRVKMSNIRTEIVGLQNIRTYCQTNSISTIYSGVSYIQKGNFNNLSPVNKDDFNFRLSLNMETKLEQDNQLIKTMLAKWKDQKKTFRHLNRCKLRHRNPSLPFIIDLTIVKESKKQGRFYVPEYNIQDSGVFSATENYEIEIEAINSLVGLGTVINTAENLNKLLKPVIKYVLAGLQETNYPVSYPEQRDVLDTYMKLMWGEKYDGVQRISPDDFVGPSSYTLQMANIRPINADSSAPNIRVNYTVTDKADGDRKLLYISPNGRMYLITTNMDVQFTGVIAKNTEVWNTIIDGEHILHDKNHKFINMYTAFDIYYANGVDVRAQEFITEDDVEDENKYRLPLLNHILGKMRSESLMGAASPTPLNIVSKRFYIGSDRQSIFTGCAFILKKEHDGLFEYETDGLIFTPTNKGVSSNKSGEYVKPVKTTWEYSFKWKPVIRNTIDFMVTLKKNENGTEFIGNVFQTGNEVASASTFTEYKTAILRVGFDERKHGYINPYQDTIDDKLPYEGNVDNRDKYVPMQFFPTNPMDNNAGICNLVVRSGSDTSNQRYIFTENDEIIEDNMIVEFRYDATREEKWRWIPLKVRYDKTAQLRSGKKNFGNAFHVANSNWQSIHDPITPAMIMTGNNIPDEIGDDDVYYNKTTGVSKTRALRDFHNLYVKKILINSVSRPGDTLIDLAVGMGGDFPKWINAKLKFVFGVDISPDNINNRMNGAYARYLNFRKKYNVMPAALFVNGNSSVNIRSTQSIFTEKDKQITRAVFGQGPKDEKKLGKGVYKQYAIGSEGFNVSSIQFAIQYMFETIETFHNFLRNVSEVTKVGGYFIGTSYDGAKIFDMLKNVAVNESKTILVEDLSKRSALGNQTTLKKKIWEVTKRYDHTSFPDDETSIGYAIDVFQESINKNIREYLVNYNYLTRMLENYGFVPVTSDELTKMNSSLRVGIGSFNDLFTQMNEETKQNSRAKASYGDAFSMTPEEKTISFLNRYFVYKKIRNVADVDAISMKLKHKTGAEAENEIQNISEPKRFSQNLGPISSAYKGTAADAAATALKEQKPVKRIIKRKVADPKAAQQGPPAAAAAATAAPAPAATAVVERAPVVKRKGKNIEL